MPVVTATVTVRVDGRDAPGFPYSRVLQPATFSGLVDELLVLGTNRMNGTVDQVTVFVAELMDGTADFKGGDGLTAFRLNPGSLLACIDVDNGVGNLINLVTQADRVRTRWVVAGTAQVLI